MSNIATRKDSFFKTIIDSSPAMIFIVERSGQIVDFNAAGSRLASDNPEMILMHQGGDVLGCINAARITNGCGRTPFCKNCVIRNTINTAFEGKRLERQRAAIKVNKHGQLRETHFLVSASMFEYEGEEFVMLTLENNNKQIEAENLIKRHSEFLSVLLDTVPSPLYYKDKKARYLGCNIAYEKALGKKRHEILGRTINEVYTNEEGIFYFNKDIELLENPGLQVYEYKSSFADGTKHDLIIHKSTYNDQYGKVAGIIGILFDITELKKVEAELIKSKEKLSRANRTKDKFLSILAHDLKNPIGSFYQLTEYADENLNTLDKNSLEEILSVLRKSAKNSYELLENLLKWARTQSGSMSINNEEFDIVSILLKNFELVESHANSKNISLKADTPFELVIYSDPDMIDTVIRNLITNAIKFTREGGSIEACLTENDGQIKVSV
ncbi:MAG: PAS domain S-box protein, partial [Bacteroidota bacterium]